MSDAAIETRELGRVYTLRGVRGDQPRERVALKSVNLTVRRGELFGLLGPNGAGKTTLIKMLTTLLAPTHGEAYVAGIDVARFPERVRPLINMVSGGESSGYGLLTVRENLWMFGQLYGLTHQETYRRIDSLLAIIGLSDRAHTKTSDLSTGLRQKMNIVRGFLTDPQVIFLDEPTLGLDVNAGRDVRDFVRGWMAERTERTLLLTTHYMAEADELCDRVAIINDGRVLACDTPANLKRRLQRDAFFRLETTPIDAAAEAALRTVPALRTLAVRRLADATTLEAALVDEAGLADLIGAFVGVGVRLKGLQKREATLEDVFVDLVGVSMAEAESVQTGGTA